MYKNVWFKKTYFNHTFFLKYLEIKLLLHCWLKLITPFFIDIIFLYLLEMMGNKYSWKPYFRSVCLHGEHYSILWEFQEPSQFFMEISDNMVYFLFTSFFNMTIVTEVICQYCEEKMSRNTSTIVDHTKLCQHVLRSDSNFTFVCLFCSYHTYSRQRMADHVKIHLGEKPHKCSFCPYATAISSNLKKHVQIKH